MPQSLAEIQAKPDAGHGDKPVVLPLSDPAYSARYSSKGALLQELRKAFAHLAQERSVAMTRDAAVKGIIWAHKTQQTRNTCWDHLHYRYLSGPHAPATAIANLFLAELPEGLRSSVLYFHYALRDALVFDFVIQHLWSAFLSGRSSVSVADMELFLRDRSKDHPEVDGWATSTRKKLAHSILAALRDFGVLAGASKKRLGKPYVSHALALYIATYGKQVGMTTREILDGPLPHLFFLDGVGMRGLLLSAARARNIEFTESGSVVSLQLPWRTVDEYTAQLGREDQEP